jgi:hypothetical protein
MREDVTKFIEVYRDSFSRGPSAMAEFYSEPCVTARVGVVRVNATRNDTELLFVEVEARYRASRAFESDTEPPVLDATARPRGRRCP